MRWVSALAEEDSFELSIDRVLAQLEQGLPGAGPDLVVAFAPPAAWPALSTQLSSRFPRATVVGASASGVIGGGREREGPTAVSALAASLPNAALVPFYLGLGEIPDPTAPESFRARLGIDVAHAPAFLLLPDPFTCDVDRLNQALDTAWPGCPKFGGLASGGRSPGGTVLFAQGRVYDRGVVGLAMFGDIAVETVVAQGARPVGEVFVVTACSGSRVTGLDERPVIAVLEEAFAAMRGVERALFRQAPVVGIGVPTGSPDGGKGAFLVRPLVGVDRAAGVMAVGGAVEVGDLLQLHLRSAATAAQDLEDVLAARRGAPPSGALLFSCVGRGERLFGVPDHDSRLFRRSVGDVPLAGFFCNGEIGPVRGRTFVHGFTSAFAFFSPRGWD